MGFWILIALVVATWALRRVIGLERAVRELRGEIVTLRARLAQLTPQQTKGETSATVEPAAPETVPPSDAGPIAVPPLPVADVSVPAGGVSLVTEAGAEAAASSTTTHAAPVNEQPPSGAAPHAAYAPLGSDLEARIGSRWLLYFGVGTLVLGISYFVKFAFDNEWIAPPVRVLLGMAAGVALVAIGHRFIHRGLARYGQALTGGGIGSLYLSTYAAFHWYGFVGRPLALALMVAITLGGVWLADRQRSQVLAVSAVAIGFLTPFLIGGEGSAQVALFTYDLILVAGTLLLARRRDWPALNIVSFVLTALTIAAWSERYYQRSEYATTELFLTAFLVLFLYVLREHRRSSSPIAALGTGLLGSSPVLYHLASLAVLGPHRGPLLVYFIAFSVAGVIAAQHFRSAWLRAAIWVGVAVPFLGFASVRLPRSWQVAAWVTLAAIYGVHLIAQAQSLDEERDSLRVPEIALLHANGLWALMALWLLLAPRDLDRLAPIAFGLAALYAVIAAAARTWHREASLHTLTLSSVLAAAACAIHFSGPWLAVALGGEGTALVWLGLRQERHWLRHTGSLFLSIAVALLLVLLARPLGLGSLPFLNARAGAALFVVALLYGAAAITRRLARPPGSLPFSMGRLVIVANLLTLLLLSAEVSAYFGWSAWAGQAAGGGGAVSSAELARQLALSIVWASYAVALVGVGLRLSYRPIRILAILVFAVTILKVFLVDLAELDRVYRMLSVIGLGLLLLTASYLYQRLRSQVEPRSDAELPLEEA